jgi:hypothetical protein
MHMPKRPFDHSFAAIVTIIAVLLWYFAIKALITGEAEMRGIAPQKRETAPLAYVLIISAPSFILPGQVVNR